MKRFKLVLMVMFVLSQVLSGQNKYKIVYHADREGEVISGSLDSLINGINAGAPVRVGWKLALKRPNTQERIEMIHWADGGFMTVIGSHVYAQIAGIFQQGPMLSNPPSVILASEKADSWVAIISTSGKVNQHFYMSKEDLASLTSSMTEEEMNKFLLDMENVKMETMWALPE